MKKTFYFSHDYNARSDSKIKSLTRKLWMEWYWLYWAIIEDLYNNTNVLQLDYEGIAYDYRVDEKTVKSLILDYELFIIDWNDFYSKSVWDRLKERDEKSAKARESIKKRWDKKNTNVLQTKNDTNTIKERKGKESKVNNIYREFKHLKLTQKEFDNIIKKYSKEKIDSTLDDIENYKKNTSYTSLNLTLQKWLRLEDERKDENKKEFEKKGEKNFRAWF